jgi:hypothetical protein
LAAVVAVESGAKKSRLSVDTLLKRDLLLVLLFCDHFESDEDTDGIETDVTDDDQRLSRGREILSYCHYLLDLAEGDSIVFCCS